MTDAPRGDVTVLLMAWREGGPEALEALAPVVYDELRRIARRHMANEKANTLQPTALVNEAFLRLINTKQVAWQDRAHFFAVAAKLMRHILIDRARARKMQKRGGGAARVTISEGMLVAENHAVDVIALDEALTALAEMDPRKAQVVEMRFFGGLGVDQVAFILGVSNDTVERDWKLARSWLRKQLA
jgi:RNA polymerase sigma factor (TIGR02999 family)